MCNLYNEGVWVYDCMRPYIVLWLANCCCSWPYIALWAYGCQIVACSCWDNLKIVVLIVEMCILICCVFAGMGKPHTRGYPPGAGSTFYPRAHSRAGKGRRRGYARGRVNVLPAHTRPAAIPICHAFLRTVRFSLPLPWLHATVPKSCFQ
jgi:hypothetical protein